MSRQLKTKSLLSLAITSAIAMPALADNAKDETNTIEEVAVIAKKLSYANNTVDVTMIDQQAPITSVLAVMDNLPGISINEGDAFGGDDWSTSINMRGFSIDGNQQQLGMTVDGIPNGGSNYGGGAKANRYLDTDNLLTVEVAQGTSDISSASLDALGGTFNFVSKDPEQQQSTTIAYTTGSHDAQRYFARYETGEIAQNTFAYISYSDTSTSRWVGKGSNGGADKQHAEVKFVSTQGKFTYTGRLSYDDVAEDNYNNVSIDQFKQTPDWDQLTWNWTGIPHFDQMFAEGWSTLRENTLAYVKIDYALSDVTNFEVTPYYHKNKGRGDWIPPYLILLDDSGDAVLDEKGNPVRYGFADQQGLPLAPAADCTANYSWPWNSGTGLHPACYGDDAVPVMSFRHTHYAKERTGFTAKAQTTIGDHDLLAGIWYETSERDEHRDWHKVIDARVYHHFDQIPYWTQYKNTFDQDTLKWYLQDTITISDFTLNLGVQQYLVDIKKTDHFHSAKNAKVDSDSDVLFSTGLLYQLNPATELFAGYSENFASIKDGVLERDTSTLTEIEPETAENIDFGIRYFGENLNLQVTAYSIEFNDRITFIAPGSNTDGIDYTIGTNGTYLNVGGIDSTGLELSASYKLNDNWELYASFTKNDSEYVGNAPGFEKGQQVIDSVDDMWVLSANYYNGDLRFGASTKYTGERGQADDYLVTDVNLGYTINFTGQGIKSVDLALVVNNLFDEDYLSTGTGNGTSFFIGAPRTTSLTVNASF
ncbi:TonB-dependent receptor [Thalassotalea insulae]|uniref:TonB-dependent receptor n=1 Tax=Thalassotalea insulae TaxID=2056778 RepID=A0ABQ6GME5_9GAMM|nr:TonB-dependent receptor [Thalassotalea insulae]GLX76784.1 TonB-dependent receptor [Thalassotalea insulae]